MKVYVHPNCTSRREAISDIQLNKMFQFIRNEFESDIPPLEIALLKLQSNISQCKTCHHWNGTLILKIDINGEILKLRTNSSDPYWNVNILSTLDDLISENEIAIIDFIYDLDERNIFMKL